MSNNLTAVFRLFKISLNFSERERFTHAHTFNFLPCGTQPATHEADSLWVLATQGYLKIPEAGQRGTTPLCHHCSYQLSCIHGNQNHATPDSLPHVPFAEVFGDDPFVGTNVVVVDSPHLIHAPFDE